MLISLLLTLTLRLANVFSSTSIADANPGLRSAMEQVASRAESLIKDKARNPPLVFWKRTTESIYSRVYMSDSKTAREQRAKQREVRQDGIAKLGEVEYKCLLQEVDLMTHERVNIYKIIDKRLKGIEERFQAEEKEKENQERRQTRSQAGTSSEEPTKESTSKPTAAKATAEKEPQERPTKAGKKPKSGEQMENKQPKAKDGQMAQKQPKTAEKWPKTAGKKPKTSDLDKKSTEAPRTTKGGKKPKTTMID